MNLIRQQLDREYKSIIKAYNTKSFYDFYNSIFKYFDFTEKQPEICKLINYDRNDIYEKKQQISTGLSKREEKAVISKIEKYSLSHNYDRILNRIYIPIKEYRELLSPIKNQEHARGCALSDGEKIEPLFMYLLDIILFSILRNHNEKSYSYFKIGYKYNMPEYKKIIDEIHSVLISKLIQSETIPKDKTVSSSELEFNSEKSVLIINNKEVKIRLKSDNPDGHYVLEYLFDNGIENPADYSDILMQKFNMDKKDNKSMYRACNDINRKVFNQAGVKDFLDVHSGKTGWVRINPDYA